MEICANYLRAAGKRWRKGGYKVRAGGGGKRLTGKRVMKS